MSTAPRLAAIDYQIDTEGLDWKEIERWAEKQIEDTKDKLCAKGLSVEETEFERGRISAVRSLLQLAREEPDNLMPAPRY